MDFNYISKKASSVISPTETAETKDPEYISACAAKRTIASTKKKLSEMTSKFDLKSLNCDASMNELLAANALFASQLEASQRNAKDGFDETVQTIPVLYIAIIYIILYSLLGLFYNKLLTQSIIPLVGSLSSYITEPTIRYDETWIKINDSLNKHRFALFIIVFLILFTVNIGFIYILILKGTNTQYAMKVVTISTLAITGIIFLLTNNVTFVKIFENTIGYTITSSFPPVEGKSFSEFINSLFKHDLFTDGIDYTFLFTVFRLDNFGDIIKDITKKDDSGKNKYDFTLAKDIGDKSLNDLLGCVVMKNTIGHFCWLIFSSIATTLVSVKYLSQNL